MRSPDKVFDRTTVRALTFLFFRAFVNSARRALGHPTRVLGLLFFLGTYTLAFLRPLLFGKSSQPSIRLPGTVQLDFPPLAIVEGVVFGLFCGVTIMFMMSSSNQLNSFKQSDVDILFPTPASHKTVLVFRILRDYLFTLIIPLIFLLFGAVHVAEGWQELIRNFPYPQYANLAIRGGFIGYFLIAVTWVSISYSTSLLINRSDNASTRNKRLLSWSLTLSAVFAVTFAVLQFKENPTGSTALALSQHPLLRTIFFTATLATQLVMAPMTQNWAMGAVGVGGLLALTGLALKVAMLNTAWMYDQAAARGHSVALASSIKAAQRKGDFMAIATEMARQGKVKSGGLGWAYRRNSRGPWALLWKEPFLNLRGMLSLIVMIIILTSMLMAMVTVVQSEGDVAGSLFFVIATSNAILASAFTSQMGALEMLRRVDMLKPLPFRLSHLVYMEILGRAIIPSTICLLVGLVATLFRPINLPFAVASIPYVPSMCILFTSVVYFVSALFPDFEDVTQKQFRGLMTLLGFTLSFGPPISVLVTLWIVKVPIFVVGTVSALVALGLSVLAAVMTAKVYESYNPSE